MGSRIPQCFEPLPVVFFQMSWILYWIFINWIHCIRVHENVKDIFGLLDHLDAGEVLPSHSKKLDSRMSRVGMYQQDMSRLSGLNRRRLPPKLKA